MVLYKDMEYLLLRLMKCTTLEFTFWNYPTHYNLYNPTHMPIPRKCTKDKIKFVYITTLLSYMPYNWQIFRIQACS